MTNNLKPDPNDRRYEVQSRTNVHFLVFHLTLADAIVSFITMPMETIWRVVIEVQSSLTSLTSLTSFTSLTSLTS